jgi:hypothetical protein
VSLFFFVVEADKPLFRIPLSVMQQLPEHGMALPGYEGKRIRIAEVGTNDDANGVPQEVRNVWGWYLNLDEDGLVRKDEYQEWLSSAFYKMNFSLSGKENVVDLETRAKRRDAERKHEWKPDPQEMASIIEAALGHPKAIKNVASTKLKKPPGPKVSYESTEAFRKMRSAISDITYAAFQLEEGELLGLQQLIEEHVESKIGDHRAIWRGILADNAEALKLMQARRTGSGEWIASVELMRWNESETEAKTVKSWYEKHPTREAAIEAAKLLAQKHVTEMKPNMSFEARVVSALDWQD